MKKYKIVVYAICKNEEKFVEKWVNSMKEADEIYVLDTGSTDNTVEELKKRGVHVEQKIITPWRFEVARNESLKLVPKDTDICVCTDLDELFLPGWRQELENKWQDDTVQAHYKYNWQLDKYGNSRLSFYYDKIHNLDFEWKYPVHEILIYKGEKERKRITLPTVTLNHYRDTTKSRSSYKDLLELGMKELPNDTRLAYLTTREYVVYNEWDKVIETGKKYLEISQNTLYSEKCSVLRYIARAYKYKKDYDNARIWYNKAIEVAPKLREPLIELGLLEKKIYNYGLAIELFEKALTITERSLNVIHEIFAWDETIYLNLSTCYRNIGNLKKAFDNIKLAEEINPDSERIQKDKKLIIALLKVSTKPFEED